MNNYKGRPEGKFSKVECTTESTPYGRDPTVTDLPRGEMTCKFEEDGNFGSRREAMNSLHVDGDVILEHDSSEQKTVVKSHREPLNVYSKAGKLVVTTDSSEGQSDRKKGEMDLPSISQISDEPPESGSVVSHFGCVDNVSDGGGIKSDCGIAVAEGDFNSAGDVDEVKVVGDVDAYKSAGKRALDVRPRNSIMEISYSDSDSGLRVNVTDRRKRMSGQGL